MIAVVAMKDGRGLMGVLWYYNRQSWYLTIPEVTDELLYLRDMVLATSTNDVDLLEQARLDGWDGVS